MSNRIVQDRLMALHDDAQAIWYNGFLRKLFPTNPRSAIEPSLPSRNHTGRGHVEGRP